MAKQFAIGRVRIWKARDGWRWHAVNGGRIVAESGEAYTRKRDCLRAARKFSPPAFVIIWPAEGA